MARPAKILVIEDELFLLDIYKETLTGAGHEVDTAADGDQALTKLKKGGYDLVLLDVMLPKKDGLEILIELHKHKPKAANKKIVYMTNLGQDGILKDGGKYGVTEYLIKSELTPDQFLSQVNKLLEQA